MAATGGASGTGFLVLVSKPLFPAGRRGVHSGQQLHYATAIRATTTSFVAKDYRDRSAIALHAVDAARAGAWRASSGLQAAGSHVQGETLVFSGH